MTTQKLFAAGLALAALCSTALAQTYPTKPVRFVVASGPGGSTDTLARTIGERMSAGWSHGIVYDNRPGAGGIIAGEVTSLATADGYTLLFSTSAAIAVSVNLYKKIPYDPVKDFAPIVLAATQPYMLITHPSSVKSVKELIETAKAKPGALSFSHTGAGSGTHLAGELFKHVAQVKLLDVPYKTISASIAGVASGEVQMTFTSVFSAWGAAKAGRARALAVAAKTRSAAAPEVPTFAEVGLPGYESGNWYGILAPAGTPVAILERVNKEANAVLANAQTQQLLIKRGYEPAGGSRADFARFIKAEIAEYSKLIKAAGLKAH